MSRSTATPIPRSVLALLRRRWRTNADGYSAFDSVFHGIDDGPHHDAKQLAKRQQYRRERQMDPAYYCFSDDLDRIDLDYGQRFTHPEAAALLRDAVFEDVSEDGPWPRCPRCRIKLTPDPDDVPRARPPQATVGRARRRPSQRRRAHAVAA